MDEVVNRCGRQLLEFIEDFGLMVLNGITKADRRGELTFVSGQGSSVIDYCLARGNWISIIDDFEVPTANYSGHMPIVTSLILPGVTVGANNAIKSMKWVENRAVAYKRRLDAQLNCRPAQENWSCDQASENILDIIRQASFMRKKPQGGKIFVADWFDWECRKLRKKSFAFLNLFRKTNSVFFKTLYLETNKQYKNLLVQKRKLYVTGVAADLSSCKDSKTFWSKVRLLGGCKNVSPSVLTVEKLADHFKDLLNTLSVQQKFEYALPLVLVPELDGPFSMEELQGTLKSMKNDKSAGIDGIPAEFYKNSSQNFLIHINLFYNSLLDEETIPKSFLKAWICAIFKKGDPQLPNNYRGISILPCLRKIFTHLLYHRLTKWVEENQLLSIFQAGFRSGLSTVDHIFALTTIAKIFLEKKKKLYVFFVDFKAAFDTVNRSSLIYKISNLGISTKLLNLYKLLISDTSAAIWNGSKMSDFFYTSAGVPQGCGLSPLMFALYIDDVSKDFPGGIKVGETDIKMLLYADDIVLLADNPTALQLQINKLKKFCDLWDLSINVAKSKIMVFENSQRRRTPQEKWFLERAPIEIVNQYKYLGFLIKYNLDLRPHVKEKCTAAKTALNLMWSNFFCNKYVDATAKFKVFDATVKTCMCYANQVFGYQNMEEFEVIQRFFLKRVFKLANSTPTYAIHVETGIPQIFLKNLKSNADYIIKVMERSDSNLQKQLLKYALRRQISPFKEWNDLANRHSVDLNLNNTALTYWQDLFYSCIAKVDDSLYLQCLNRAQTSPTRLIYKELNHTLFANNYFNEKLTINQLSLIFKARTEMLCLNYRPHRNDLRPICSLCNRNEIENVYHFLAVCPILQEIRRLYFSKSILTLDDTKDLLNGCSGWKILCIYMNHALGYRSSFID